MFTTKPLGEGTGLGLSIVHGVVQQTGGHVELHSSPGRGTTIEVLLPLTTEPRPAAPSAPSAPEQSEARQPGQGTILLVEDDDAVRDLTRRVLEGDGYTVVAAASAEEALTFDGDGASIFDLVLTDNTMADMTGVELVRRMATSSRGLPAIVMSGYVAEPAPDERAEATIVWLQKPFDASTLLDAVRDALD
jgi:CheY-like chemotaxis protein